MAVVRGLAQAPDMGGQRCYAVEIAFEQGSGICEWHLRQIKERRRAMP